MLKLGVTHIITWNKTSNKELTERFILLNLLDNPNEIKMNSFYHIQKSMDFIRHCMVYKGNQRLTAGSHKVHILTWYTRAPSAIPLLTQQAPAVPAS